MTTIEIKQTITLGKDFLTRIIKDVIDTPIASKFLQFQNSRYYFRKTWHTLFEQTQNYYLTNGDVAAYQILDLGFGNKFLDLNEIKNREEGEELEFYLLDLENLKKGVAKHLEENKEASLEKWTPIDSAYAIQYALWGDVKYYITRP